MTLRPYVISRCNPPALHISSSTMLHQSQPRHGTAVAFFYFLFCLPLEMQMFISSVHCWNSAPFRALLKLCSSLTEGRRFLDGSQAASRILPNNSWNMLMHLRMTMSQVCPNLDPSLVVQHHHGKWPISRWFTSYISMSIFHDKPLQRLPHLARQGTVNQMTAPWAKGLRKKQMQLPVKFTEPSGDKVDIIDSGKIGAAWLALSSLIFCSHYLVPTGFSVFLELKFFSTEKCRKSEHHSKNWDILVECDAGLNSFHGALVTWMFLVCCNHCGARLGMDSSYTCIPPNH
jgi:hypothetical protein